jgi:hypothetical protein
MVFDRFDQLEQRICNNEVAPLPPKLMTQKELAEYLGVTVQTIINSKVPTIRINSVVRYDLKKVLEKLERR